MAPAIGAKHASCQGGEQARGQRETFGVRRQPCRRAVRGVLIKRILMMNISYIRATTPQSTKNLIEKGTSSRNYSENRRGKKMKQQEKQMNLFDD